MGQLPARLTAEQVAWVVNCQPHDVPMLVAVRLLKPLGNPPPNSVKFFALALSLVLRFHYLAGFILVCGLETGAFAADFIHAIEHASTAATAG